MSAIRRMMMRKAGGKIEKPDYFRFDFTTDTPNESIAIGSYLYYYIDDCILDGVTQSLVNSSPLKINVPNTGTHTLYYHLYKVLPSNYNLNFIHSASYVRLPYNVSEMCLSLNIQCGSWNNKWDVIDILDHNFVGAVKSNGYRTYSKADAVNVPKGSKQAYVDAGTDLNILNKMNEVDFNY